MWTSIPDSNWRNLLGRQGCYRYTNAGNGGLLSSIFQQTTSASFIKVRRRAHLHMSSYISLRVWGATPSPSHKVFSLQSGYTRNSLSSTSANRASGCESQGRVRCYGLLAACHSHNDTGNSTWCRSLPLVGCCPKEFKSSDGV